MYCLNCNQPLTENQNFCSQCGARIVKNRLTLRWYFSEVSNSVFKMDNKLFKTFKMLVIDPSAVVIGYIQVVRKRYIDPLRFLLIALFFSGIYVYLLRNGYLGEMNYNLISSSQNEAFDTNKFMQRYMNVVYDYYNIIMFMSIPFLAVISKIVFYNIKSFNLVEHLVLYTYTYSFCSVFGFLFSALNLLFKMDITLYSLFNLLVYILYHIFALKKIFNLNGKQITLKTLLFIPVLLLFYLVFSTVFATVFLIYLFASGALQT